MKPLPRHPRQRFSIACIVLLTIALVAVSFSQSALAQNPFGAPRSPPDATSSGIIGWLLAKQSEFYRQISSAIRAAKSDGSAVWALMGISFGYGVFHAAGPGHGKAVISSYLLANEETARRGIVLSFASALMQSLVAVVIVGICAGLLDATARTMCSTERAVEIASYALIAVFGARLVYSKGTGLLRAMRSPVAAPGHAHHHVHAHDEHADGRHQPSPGHGHGHGHADVHVHDEHCGHAHGPLPNEVAGVGGWQRGFGAILSVGLRPCSGAILVLVFALAQGMFWAGVAATFVMGLGTAITVAAIALISVFAKGLARRLIGGREGGGVLVMRGLEFAAAGVVLLFGVGLLFGYAAAERVTCF